MDPSPPPSPPVVSSDELAKQLKRISDHLSELTTTSTLGGSLNSARARRKPTQKMSSIKSAVNPYSRLKMSYVRKTPPFVIISVLLVTHTHN